jgi:hypothetical protein
MTAPETNLLKQARLTMQYFVAERARRGIAITPEQAELATAFLVEVWPIAERFGVTPDKAGWDLHLPRGVLDAVVSITKPQRGGSKR